MNRAGGLLAAVLVCAVSGCAGSSEPNSRSSTPDDARTTLVSDTSPRGRLAFGCALERGIDQADAGTRHYGAMAVRELFIAALEAKPGYAAAAELWKASDNPTQADEDRAAQVRAAVVKMCSSLGFTARAGLPEMRAYACRLTSELIRDRPNLASFGAERTAEVPGDPRRTDGRFIGTATFLLAMKESNAWLDSENLFVAVQSGNPTRYEQALDSVSQRCADPVTSP